MWKSPGRVKRREPVVPDDGLPGCFADPAASPSALCGSDHQIRCINDKAGVATVAFKVSILP